MKSNKSTWDLISTCFVTVNPARSVYVNIWLAVLPCPRPVVLPHCARTHKLRCVFPFLQVTTQGISNVGLLKMILMSYSLSYEPYKICSYLNVFLMSR